jgi:hypothetical protein
MSIDTQNPLYNAALKNRKQKNAERYANFSEPEDLRVMLKVKIRSLQDEAQLIRRKEQGHPRGHQVRGMLMHHRKTVVRTEARSAQLALCFLRGRAYIQAEQFTHPGCDPDWYAIKRMVARFGHYARADKSPDQNRIDRAKFLSRFEEWQVNAVEDMRAARNKNIEHRRLRTAA